LDHPPRPGHPDHPQGEGQLRGPARTCARPGRASKATFHLGVPWWELLVRSAAIYVALRSEEHTSELQSLRHLVCRLLLVKTKKRGTRSCLSTRIVFATGSDQHQDVDTA